MRHRTCLPQFRPICLPRVVRNVHVFLSVRVVFSLRTSSTRCTQFSVNQKMWEGSYGRDIRALSQDWWIFLMEGVLAIVFGLLLLVWPGPTTGVVIVLVGLFALLSGIVGVFAAIGAAGNHQPWAWKLITAMLGILAGLAIMRWPGLPPSSSST